MRIIAPERDQEWLKVYSGDACIGEEGKTKLELISLTKRMAVNFSDPSYLSRDDAFLELNSTTFVNESDFFCVPKFGDVLASVTIPIGVVVGLLALLQLLNIRAAFVVLYRIPQSMGGFVSDDGYNDFQGQYGEVSSFLVNYTL